MILILQTTTFGAHGGIPTYNRVLCRALDEFHGLGDKKVLVLTDSPDEIESGRADFQHLDIAGFAGRRWSLVYRTLALAMTTRIDLLIAGHVNLAPLAWAARRLQPSLPYGVMVHGVDVWSKLSWTRRKALQKADFITSVSEYSKEQAIRLNGVEPQRLRLLPNALEWLSEGEVSPLPASSGIRLLSVCRLDARERYKGVDTVIRSLPSVLKKIPKLDYFIVGTGTDLERHRHLANELDVADKVHLVGSVDGPTLRAHYNAADIFIMPSAGEGFGIVFLEAMKYRKPVIAANSGAVSEVVQAGETGVLVEYGNANQIADAIVNLASNQAERSRMGQAGHSRLMMNFTYEHFRQRFSQILQQEIPSASQYKSRRETFDSRKSCELGLS